MGVDEMIIGITGTRLGATRKQLWAVETILESKAKELHHGDCIGVDAQAHAIAKRLGIKTVAYPGHIPQLRANCEADVIHEAQDTLARNKLIVDACDFLLVVPHGEREIMRSGTWSTKRYAQRIGRSFYIVLP